jgi:LysR family glycine cleavage system transcriptional activator
MTAAAAAQGMGLALVPRMLIEDELARGELVVACEGQQMVERAYYLVTPERAEERSSTKQFLNWLQQAVQDPV